MINARIPLALVALAALPIEGTQAGPVFGSGVQYFTWSEYGAQGRLLQESGARGFISADYQIPLTKRWAADLHGRLYGGTVQYDGQYQDGTPAQTQTAYNGLAVEANALFFPFNNSQPKQAAGHAGTALAIGVGSDAWAREIQGQGGYGEDYRLDYITLGLQRSCAGSRCWDGGIAFQFPLQITEQVKLYDGTTLHPVGQMGFRVGVGYRWTQRWSMGAEYSAYRFGASPVSANPITFNGVPVDVTGDNQGGDYVRQPESHADFVNLALRYRF